MSKAKEIMIEYLKEKGASEETLADFNKAYDEDFTKLINVDVEKAREQQRIEKETFQNEVRNLAAEISLRK